MASEDVILYTHAASAYAQRVHVAMVEKGIPFKAVYVDFYNKPAGLLEANPNAEVPTLVHGKNPICESLVILENLDEAWPETTPLLPKNSDARAKAKVLADFIYDGFCDLQTAFMAKANTPGREAGVAEMPKYLKGIENAMTEYSAEGLFFTGSKFEYLDVILLPMVNWLPIWEKLLETPRPGPDQLPRVHKWIEAVREHKSYKEAIRSDEEIYETFSNLMKRRVEDGIAAAKAKGKPFERRVDY